MAKTMVQQSQISGSLAFDDTLAAGSSLAGKQSIVGDLDALRSQINKIIGGDRWYDALSGSQDLADIWTAVRMTGADAAFQGDISAVGDVSAVDGSFSGNLSVNGNTTLGDASSDTITFTAVAASDLAMDSHKVSGLAQATAAGDALAWGQDASVSDLIVTAGEFTVDASGNVVSAELKITGDNVNTGALYLVGASGEIAEEANLVFSAGSLDITGALDVSGVVDAGELYVGGPTGLSGTLAVNGVSDFAADVYMAADLYVSGAMEVAQGLTVSGDRLEVTGSFGLTGAAEIGGTLDVDGAVTFGSSLDVVGGITGSAGLKIEGDADFNSSADFAGAVNMQSTLGVTGAATFDGGLDVNGSGITANSIAIDGDVAGRLYIVDGSGYISDEELLNFSGGELQVTGSLKVTSSALVEGTLNVDGAADFDSTADFAGAVVMQSSLDVDGAVDIDSTLDVAGNAMFRANVDVVGNLTVQGSMTYIETQNLKVLDAFIHLATGSTGTQSSGIVLHGGAGASDDLMLAQDAGGGEFVFAKLAHSNPDHDDVDGDNSVDVNGAALVPVWMSGLKVGALEGSLSGSLSATSGGLELSSTAGKDLSLVAGDALNGGDLLLSANGETAISFIEAGEWAAFDAQFPGQSLVSAIVAAGGNFKQDSFQPGAKNPGDAIDYSSVGALRATSYATLAAKKLAMDVFLNGVRLAYGDDYSIAGPSDPTPGELTLTMSTMADDRLLVVIHNAAV